jgi:hypothetical protein
LKANSADGLDLLAGTVQLQNVAVVGTPNIGVNVVSGGLFSASLTADHLTVVGGNFGIYAQGTSVSLRDSIVRQAAADGVDIFRSQALIERCEFSNNATGLVVDASSGGSVARISDSVITQNGTGVSAVSGGQIISFRTNMLAGNTTDGAIPFSVSLK